MTLKMRTETVHVVDYDDFDQFVLEKYPTAKHYQFTADQESSNNSEHRFNVTADSIYGDEIHASRMAEWLDSDGFLPFFTSELLTDMCKRGYIEPGTYLIEVFW